MINPKFTMDWYFDVFLVYKARIINILADRYKIDLGKLVYGWIYMSMLRNMLQISY